MNNTVADERVIVHAKTAGEIPWGDIPTDGVLFVDLETYGHEGGSALNVRENHPRLLTITGETGPVILVDLMEIPIGEVVKKIEGRLLVGHNLAFDLPVLVRHGMEYPQKVHDTMLASQVLMAGIPNEGHSLLKCMKRFLGKEIVKDQGASKWEQPELTPEQIRYAADDVLHLRELYPYLLSRLEKYGLLPTMELECALLPSIVAMSLQGVLIDVAQWMERSQRAAVEAKRLKGELLGQLPIPDERLLREVKITKKGTPAVADMKHNAKAVAYNSGRIAYEDDGKIDYDETRLWNLGSPKQVVNVFARIGVFLPDTSHETLVELKGEHPILDTFVDYRVKEKEATAFGLDWLKNVDKKTNRIYPGWRQMGADSGRMSCADPNVTQTPRGETRKGYTASPGNLLVRADFSQIEARVAALVSQCPTLTRLFIESATDKTFDIHRYTAGKVLDKEISQVTKEERQIGKSLLFGLLFGMQAVNLRIYCRTNYGVKMTPTEAVTFRGKFFDVFPGLADWHRRERKKSYNQRDFRTLTGRRRFIPENIEVNRHGIALNHPVQGTAAELLKMVAVDLWHHRGEFPDAPVIALIHDEIILDAPEAKAVAAGKWLKSIMLEVGNKLIHPIPVDAEVKIGRTWGG